MEIEIPFNEWSRQKLFDYKKWATTRTKRYGEIGDEFHVSGYYYMIDLVIKVPLWFVKNCLYESEGCDSPIEFVKIWRKIHKRKGFNGNQMVWYHHFDSTN